MGQVVQAGPATSSASQTARNVERFVRLCPTHGCTLREEHRPLRRGGRDVVAEVLVCAGGPSRHDVVRWLVFDRLSKATIGTGTPDQVILAVGICDDVLVTPRLEERLPRGVRSTQRHQVGHPPTNPRSSETGRFETGRVR